MTWDPTYIGVVLIATGASLGLLKRKRAFDRTNAFGVERFPTYWRKLSSRTTDGALVVTSLPLIIAGTLVLANHYEDSWGWMVLLPAYVSGFALFLGLPIGHRSKTPKGN